MQKDIIYKHLTAFSGIEGKINDISCKFLVTECADSNTDGIDLKNIITNQPLEQGDYINIDASIHMVTDIKKVTNSSYTLGTFRKANHINKFVSDDTIYQCPSICTNITKGKLGLIYESAGITEATGVWCFITKCDDISKKISVGKRFIINGNAWKCTSLDFTTDEGILYVILRLDNINVETDDLINEVAGGLSIPKYAITLSSNSESLYRGKAYQITSICTKNNVADSAPVITYVSSNSNVAMVNSSGLVTAQSTTGACKIIVNYHNSSVDLTLNVIEDVYNITLAESSASKYNDETYQLNPTCKKDNEVVSNPMVIYSSDNTGIATVDSNGLVTMVGVGTCNIIATYQNVSASFSLEVQAHIYEIALSESSASIIQDGTYNISATCKKDSVIVSNPVIIYGTSDPAIATVSVNGEVTAISVGNCTITSTYQGVNSSLNVTVQPKPVVHTYTITMDSTGSIIQGDTLQLNPTCKDNDVTVSNPIVIYSSSDNSIAAIDGTGLITSVGIGTCTITATFEEVSATMNLEVKEKPHVYTIALDSSSASIVQGNTHQINAICTDNSVTVISPVINFISSDNSIATVSNSGLITSIAKGSCTITATYQNVSAIFNLTVTGEPVVAYTYKWSNGSTELKCYCSTAFTATKTIDGVVDPNLTISYEWDSVGASLASGGKVTMTKNANNAWTIKNVKVQTITNCTLTWKDTATGAVILSAPFQFRYMS